jgi:hypothetical protein
MMATAAFIFSAEVKSSTLLQIQRKDGAIFFAAVRRWGEIPAKKSERASPPSKLPSLAG